MIGNKVKHKSGGPLMVVASLKWNVNHNMVTTKWWDELTRCFVTEVFHSFELIEVE